MDLFDLRRTHKRIGSNKAMTTQTKRIASDTIHRQGGVTGVVLGIIPVK
jgi:hypothetical protein